MTDVHPRLRGWERALADALARQHTIPFEWGMSDCLLQVADIDLSMTGRDPMASLRGRYSTAMGATRLLHRLGFADITAALAATYEEVAPAMARRGDCGMVDGGSGDLAAVIVVGETLMGKSPAARAGGPGTTIVSRSRLVRAFKIGW